MDDITKDPDDRFAPGLAYGFVVSLVGLTVAIVSVLLWFNQSWLNWLWVAELSIGALLVVMPPLLRGRFQRFWGALAGMSVLIALFVGGLTWMLSDMHLGF